MSTPAQPVIQHVNWTAPFYANHTAVQGVNMVTVHPTAPVPQVPTIGRIVLYTLSEQDAEAINRRRDDAHGYQGRQVREATGYVQHTGNSVRAGDVYPMVITRVWGDDAEDSVNGQVLLDGNDTLWATSVHHGDGERHFAWPARV